MNSEPRQTSQDDPAPNMDEAITLTEAAHYAGLAYSSIAQAAREGRIKTRRSAGVWLTTRQDVLDAIGSDTLRPRSK
jgi:hypothetical protein